MGSSISSVFPHDISEEVEDSPKPEIMECHTIKTEEYDPTAKVLETIEQQKLTPCKAFAQEVIACVRNNHGEVMNCITPLKQYEQCVQDITYERIRKNDYCFEELNSWKI